jgi:hypothetical protein
MPDSTLHYYVIDPEGWVRAVQTHRAGAEHYAANGDGRIILGPMTFDEFSRRRPDNAG